MYISVQEKQASDSRGTKKVFKIVSHIIIIVHIIVGTFMVSV